jgi:chromosome partitioning protein
MTYVDYAVGKPDAPRGRARVVVFGNEKGGTGKSTAAANVAIALLRRGFSVGTIDLDPRQGTLSRYFENRALYARAQGVELPMPRHVRINPIAPAPREAMESEAQRRLGEVMSRFGDRDFVLIDTAGSDSALSRMGHELADVLITPINDSLIDIDVIARVDANRREVLGPSVYCRTVWERHNRRVVTARGPIQWFIMRNRLAHIESRNRRGMDALLEKLAFRIGFRIAPGFSERVVYRELFPNGLAVADLDVGADGRANVSHIAAWDEVEALLDYTGLARKAA